MILETLLQFQNLYLQLYKKYFLEILFTSNFILHKLLKLERKKE